MKRSAEKSIENLEQNSKDDETQELSSLFEKLIEKKNKSELTDIANAMITKVVDKKTLDEFRSFYWKNYIADFVKISPMDYNYASKDNWQSIKTIGIICESSLLITKQLSDETHTLINSMTEFLRVAKKTTLEQIEALRSGEIAQKFPIEIKRNIELHTLFNNYTKGNYPIKLNLTKEQQRILTVLFNNDPCFEYSHEPLQKTLNQYSKKSDDIVSKLGIREFLNRQPIAVLPLWRKLALKQAHDRVKEALTELHKEEKIPSILNLEQRKKAIEAIAQTKDADKQEIKTAISEFLNAKGPISLRFQRKR